MQSIESQVEHEQHLPSPNWNRMFARRTTLMKRTAVRELLKVTSRLDLISFAGGLPAAELFPMRRVQSAFNSVLERVGGQSLQYGETEGVRELREWIARECNSRISSRAEGRNGDFEPLITVENVLITSGSQQALDLIGRVLLEEGDRVVVENPTYLALLAAWRPLGVEFLAVESDADGMRTQVLETPLRQGPKLIYVTPNFQNPQGTTLSPERRQHLFDLAREHGVGIVEDNPYGQLRYGGKALPDILDLEFQSNGGVGPKNVIYTGTFSKVLMPGLRVGWIIAHPDLIEKLVQAKQVADLHTSSLNQHLVLELLRQGFIDEFVPILLQNYRQRRDAMLDALQRYFPPAISWSRPEGGMFLMVKLPESLDATGLLPAALERGVAYVPGEEFHLHGQGRNTVRLNFSNANIVQIENGIKRLADLFSSD
jgi:2-aminoadipate transaminase